MYRVSRQIDFCYGHRLVGYEGPCRHLHGHNGRVLITMQAAELDDLGMVLDFSAIKRTVSEWIDRHLDHRMVLHRDDPLARLLEEAGEPLLLMSVNPTAENLARLIYQVAADQTLPVTQVRLWESPKCFATYSDSEAPPGDERIEWRLTAP
jgi:6-pyruvoyltetrahydropterin/6-carboxytetrahydropterin synthase